MQSNATEAKDRIIESTYNKIMAQPTEQEQNIAALLAKAYGQGLSTGYKMGELPKRKRKRKKPA